MKNAIIFISVISLVLVFIYSLNNRDETYKKINYQKNDNQLVSGLDFMDSTSKELKKENKTEKENNNSLTPKQKNMSNSKQIQPPKGMVIDPDKNNIAIIKTSLGEIQIALNAKMTPKTANNFAYLAKNKFYDGVIFHRTIPGFMIQGGDPTGTGMGGPGYKFDDEKFSGEYKKGTVAMANSGANTNGSQFFIMHADYALPPNYVIFGQVIKGMDVVDKIATAPTKQDGEGSSPLNPVVMESVGIVSE